MRRTLWLLALLLAACTGSQEPALEALLAAGGEGQVAFYRALDLQRGLSSPVATWSAPGLQDLAYSQAFRRLYLLFPDRLEAYDATGFSLTAVPQTPTATLPLPSDCTEGYLRLGQNALLAHCPGARRAYLSPLPDPSALEEADLTGLPPSSRLALLPAGGQDLLAYLTGEAMGYRPAQAPSGTPALEKPLDAPLSGDPLDLKADGGRGRLLGLGPTATEVRLYTLQNETLQSRKVLGDFPGEARLALDPVAGLVALGRGFQVLEPRDSGPQETFTPFQAGLVGQDGYLYLAAGRSLSVYDLVPSPPQRVAFPTLGLSPKALALIPVE
ncbi:hypothetical protein [Thermus oshimai]|uniref:hypothetical protein n=1 Tax=Thermus oshimai TaxID=56957 RepID=UPI000368F0CF|nr:hypothetical protein [Thermus oshimai]